MIDHGKLEIRRFVNKILGHGILLARIKKPVQNLNCRVRVRQ